MGLGLAWCKIVGIMNCPQCGYAMSAFDKDCPRCHGIAVPQAAQPAPIAASPPTPLPAPSTANQKQGVKWYVNHVLTALALLYLLIWALAQFGNSQNGGQSSHETMIQNAINEDLRAKNYAPTCIRVTLVNESGNKYTGIATYSDGNTADV
ncbi:MAG: hypothetical protein KY445_04935, partial [Armatimonadetes bacterium]|nr:hypothetical protein [Armatimonadota bacterium]